MGRPSMNTVPSGASHRRATRAASVVFPHPVGPTTARVEPAGILRLMSERTDCAPLPLDFLDPLEPFTPERVVGYVKVRFRNSMLPCGVASLGRIAARSSILGFAVKMKFKRPMEAAPRWKIFVTQPNAI